MLVVPLMQMLKNVERVDIVDNFEIIEGTFVVYRLKQ